MFSEACVILLKISLMATQSLLIPVMARSVRILLECILVVQAFRSCGGHPFVVSQTKLSLFPWGPLGLPDVDPEALRICISLCVRHAIKMASEDLPMSSKIFTMLVWMV